MNLNVIICPGCGRTYTRADMARMLRERHNFVCECEWEHVAAPYRPYTLRELLAGKSEPLAGSGVDTAAYARAIMAALGITT